METLALGSVGRSTQILYLAIWNVWVAERKAQGKEPWLQHDADNPNQLIKEITEFMACLCYVLNNQQSIIRGYLAAIKFSHKMYTGWDLPTSHCMIVAVGKGIKRAHGTSQKKAQAAFDLVPLVARAASSRKHGTWVKRHVVGARIVVFFVIQSVRVVGVRRR